MTLLWKLTLRQIRGSRARFFVTVLGVLLSTALLTAVLVGGHSVMRSLYRAAEAQTGPWHLNIQQRTAEEAAALLADPELDTTGLTGSLQPAALADGTPVQTRTYAGEALALQNVTLLAGSPARPGQALLPEALAREAGFEVGDTITLQKDGETVAYPVAGVYESRRLADAAGGAAPVLLAVDPAALPEDAYTLWSQGAPFDAAYIRAVTARREELIANGAWSGYLNQPLFSFCELPAAVQAAGGGFSTLYAGARAFMVAVLAAGAALLIVNAFSISLAERRRTLGLLAGAGATPAQKTACLLLEAGLVAVLGVPLGLLAGLGLLAAGFAAVQPFVTAAAAGVFAGVPDVALRLYPSAASLAASAAVSLAVVLLAAGRPARLAGKTGAMAAIRGEGEVKLRRAKAGGALLGRLFGPAGTLAAKVARRSHRRYRATVASLTLAVVLLVSAAGATKYLEQGYIYSHDLRDVQLKATLYTDDVADPAALAAWDALQNPETPVEVVRVEETVRWGDLTGLSADLLSPAAGRALEPYGLVQGGSCRLAPQLLVVDDAVYEELAGAPAAVGAGDTLDVLLVNRMRYDTNFGYSELAPMTTLAPGDTLDWDFNTQPLTLRIQAVTTNRDLPVQGAGVLTLYTSRSAIQPVFDGWYAANAAIDPTARSCRRSVDFFYTTDEADRLSAELAALDLEGLGTLSIRNVAAETASVQAMLLLVRIVLYGFVGMVGLVCAANIANTVTTSVALRRREFAMLRSAGMGPAEMQRMVALESVVYACSALAWGLPIGLGVVFLAWRKIGTARLVPFSLPWAGLAAAIFGVLALTALTALPAVRRLRKMNLAADLRGE